MDKYTRFRGGNPIWIENSNASVIVKKEVWGSENSFWIKVSGVWKKCISYIKVSGVWKICVPRKL
mgnify:CR=1 FL=1